MTRHSLFPFLAAAALPLAVAAAQNVGVAFNATVDGYIEVPYAPQIVPRTGITVEAWITYDDATLPTGWRYPTILRQGLSVGGSEDYFLRVNADNVGARVLRWSVRPQGSTNAINVNWTFAAGQLNAWTHVAATYDGTTSALFVNGVQVAQAAGTGAPIRDVGNEVLRIGKGSDVATPIEVWNGQIDEVRLWPFARTQAEIQATMNQELANVPGLVSTWNLNGSFGDSSSTMNATATGQVTITPNSLALATPLLPIATGSSTPGCLGGLTLMPTSAAQAGNLGYGIVCTQTPPAAIAVWGLAAGALPGSFPLLGVGIWLDPSVFLVTATELANGLGALRVGVPIPATAPIGFAFAAQALVLDPCGSQGVTASNALITSVLP